MSLLTLAHCGFLVVTFFPEAVQLCPQSGLWRGASPGAPAWVSLLAVQEQGRHQLETDFMANPDGALSSTSQPQARTLAGTVWMGTAPAASRVIHG